MSLIKSKQRIAAHGEVFTPEWLVDEMLDLVKDESERFDSLFLEPACGSGNFLTKVLKRKLCTVQAKYGKSEFHRQYYALFSLMCIYGIELLEDNIIECKRNLLEIFADYLNLSKNHYMSRSAEYVLSQNIVHGDALTMKDSKGNPIIFAEWGTYEKVQFKRRDFEFNVLTDTSAFSPEGSLFEEPGKHRIFTPIKDYDPMTAAEIASLMNR